MKTISILYADDDENDQFIFERVIEKIAAEVRLEMVDDGMAAIEYLSGHGRYADRNRYPLPQLIFSDLKMPRVSGIGLLRWIRQQTAMTSLPVVMLSSSALENDIRTAYQLGANGYVVKSLSLWEFGDCVRDILSLCDRESVAVHDWLPFQGNQKRPDPSHPEHPTAGNSMVGPIELLRGGAGKGPAPQW